MLEAEDMRWLETLPERLQHELVAEISEAVAVGAQLVAGEAAARAPRRTGRLAASIGHEVSLVGGMPESEVFAAAPYAAAVEYGTRRMAAQPFLAPAELATEARVDALLEQALDQALDRVVDGGAQ